MLPRRIGPRRVVRIDVDRLLLEGRDLDAAGASVLERKLKRSPHDLETRARLLGFYGRGARHSASVRKKFKAQWLWFIQHAPESPACSIPIFLAPQRNRAFFKRARMLWLGHCRSAGASAHVLANAARFLTTAGDPKTVEALLSRAEAAEPHSVQWKTRLGNFYEGASTRGSSARRLNAARAALGKFEEAYALTQNRNSRFHQLPDLARTAFAAGELRKATQYAMAAVSEAELFKDWAHGNGIHHGHSVLGRILIARGEREGAAAQLLASGRTPGSPQLNSFGPTFQLAEDLLEAGDAATVLAYLELCRTFWAYGARALDAWAKQIRAGKRPDFQAAWKYLLD